jgi:hypothetical protein
MDEWERKQHARIRRERMLADGLDLTTRRVRSAAQYRRGYKHRPTGPLDWLALDEELD